MTSVCIYSANLGGWDRPEIQDTHEPQTYPCDFVYYTHDEENLMPLTDPRPPHLVRWPWCMQAKAYRVFPNKCKKLEGYDLVIHLDAQDQIINKNFVKEIVESNIFDYNLALSVHGDRHCPIEELTHVLSIGKYVETGREALTSRIEKYQKEGMPTKLGLYWDGFIVYNMHKFSNELAETWWTDINETKAAWPCSQACLVYALWKTGVKPKIMPREYGFYHYFAIHNHK